MFIQRSWKQKLELVKVSWRFIQTNQGKGQKIVIIGGVAGGASVAARLRRLDEEAHITLLEKGEYISFANCGLPYYIGNVIKDRQKLLVQTPTSMSTRFNIDILNNTEAIRIDREKKQVETINIQTKLKRFFPYDKLVLSPGAEPIRPPLKGIESKRIFTIRNIPDTDHIKNFVDRFKPKHVTVIGGGFIGLEMAENLHHKGLIVTLIEASDHVMGPLDYEMAALVHQHLKLKQIEVFLKDGVKEFEEKDNQITTILNSGKRIVADMVICSIGVRPEKKLAEEAGLKVGRGIITNERMETSDPDIYALGDAVEVKDIVSGDQALFALAGPANKQGRLVADQIVGRKESIYKGSQGTGIAKVFDLAVGSTGLNERILKLKGIDFLECVTHSSSHAGYYPGAFTMAVKLLFCPKDGRILGAQVVGADGVDKRLDLLSVAVRQKLTVYDLEEFELSYAPPFGSAKDPVNYAGFVAANMLKKDVNMIHWHQISSLIKDQNAQLIDVRTQTEHQTATIPGSINFPLDEIRNTYQQIDQNRPVILFCQQGLRGYIAYRILVQKGFKQIYNLAGGFKTWHFANLKQSNENIFDMDSLNSWGVIHMDSEKALNSNYAYWSEDFDEFSPKKMKEHIPTHKKFSENK